MRRVALHRDEFATFIVRPRIRINLQAFGLLIYGLDLKIWRDNKNC